MPEPSKESDSSGPSREPSLTERLRKLIKEMDPEISLGQGESDPEDEGGGSREPISGTTSAILRRLKAHGLRDTRYQIQGEIARGGMGVILHVWDEDMHRDLAMKVVLDRSGDQETLQTEEIPPRLLARFLEEAQITGQLDHPAIVPVHELGVDEAGHVYFTMRLVKGRDLKRIFDLVSRREPGWSTTRALGVLHKVCEAMAFAHAKGVIHRDLKPANVMVGRFGEVYVMDWGLARVLGRSDHHDLRVNVSPELLTSLSIVRTEQRSLGPEDTGADLQTMDGDVIGTPSYMAPEQARGRTSELSTAADIYSVGAMLYHLLAGHPPYLPEGIRVSPTLVLLRLIEGPPVRLKQTSPELPGELVAICEKAMAREIADRYATMLELADDLRAFLEQRVVKAYASGPMAELRKWTMRNKTAAAGLLVALFVVIGGLVLSRQVEARSRREVQASSTYFRAFTTRAEADKQWPASPARVGSMAEWLRQAEDLVAERPVQEAQLAKLEKHDPSSATPEESMLLERQRLLIALLDDLDPANPGGVAAPIVRRLDFARHVAEETINGTAASQLWSRASASISDRSQCPAYGGLTIEPQLGLLPLDLDPSSGLWEFVHLESGKVPVRGPDGRLVITEETGIVLVLVPGGEFLMGAQSEDSNAPGYSNLASPEEGPPAWVQMAPFFISKYEMTQGQWIRATGENAGSYRPENEERVAITLAHPVETVGWDESRRVMLQLGLELPTGAQWEYAARAGTTTDWWTGDDPESIQGAGNLCDLTFNSFRKRVHEEWLEDGYFLHAPVGSLAPNPWGLHDVIGNVQEWTLDHTGPADDRKGGVRGGSHHNMASQARSAWSAGMDRGSKVPAIGVRPARELTRSAPK